MNEETPGSPGKRRRVILIVVLGVLVVLGGLYVAGYATTGDRVPSGTTVAGTDIGGLSESAAVDRVSTELDPIASRPIVLTYAGERFELTPAESGLAVDAEETVRGAGAGRSWNPARMASILFGSHGAVEPVVTVDDTALTAAVEDVAAKLEQRPIDPSVRFTDSGQRKVVPPQVGIDVDEDATRELVADSFLESTAPVRLPVEETPPAVDRAAFRKAMNELIRPATSAPITLKVPGQRVQLAVDDYAPALRVDIQDGTLVPRIDEKTLQRGLRDTVAQLAGKPTDATVGLRGGRPVVIPAKPGVTLDVREVADAILPVLGKTGPARSARVGTTTLQADFTTKDARELGIKEVVSDFVTYFPYAEYRNVNQARAAELISGTVLKPGETFSFNDTVGERTEANGFVKGFIISDGVFSEELGGGVSQVVTTTYNAAFFAGLEDVEHKPHSFYIDRYPIGREATVAWPTVDLKFRNDTPHGVLVDAWVVPSTPSSQGEMHVRIWSTKYWDIDAGASEQYNFTEHKTRYDPSDECVETSGYGGFDVDVFRYFRRAGSDQLVRTEKQHVTYTPADTVICAPPPRQGDAGNR